MMFTLENRKFFECDKEERKSLRPLIQSICGVAGIVNKKGLRSLENRCEGPDDKLFRYGISLVVRSFAPDVVYELLKTKMVASFETGAGLLWQIIVIHGVLCIQNGEHPSVVEEKLLAFLGDDLDD
jgi:flagellar motor component MotA